MDLKTNKTTLGLNLPTDRRWVDIAQMSLAEILTDHAACEQKAASSCISLIIQFSEKEQIVEVLTPVVTEEWGHFRRVLAEMKKRGLKMGRCRTDEYAKALLKLERKGGNIERQLMDKLLINALIEARSAERFRLLSKNIADEGLREFYHELMVSEAGHYRNFIDLAKIYMPEAEVEARWTELLKDEAVIINNLGIRQGKFH